ncbi:ABC transporter ATP-binding protein [Microlunatus soli]|uniref:Iron complex transport system ATP-binding protein n=1 Tax=Microlunatus soli TaxID=630515 RepID=A0A1H1WJR7_9ACTN|nr:ABC transporter ATP-binding protein [Microlunatus soli]SDS97558.1 iron complex transport system ATP-binding protein [Microlunatus soli]
MIDSTSAAGVSRLRLTGLRAGYRHPHRAGLRWRRSPDRIVVDDVDATARAGQVTALLGPNGAGKSTLLRSVAGLQPLLSGSVGWRDPAGVEHDLLRMPARERARRTAVVLTERVDAGLLTGREVVELGRHPYLGLVSRLGADDHRLIDGVLADLHATEPAGQRFAELSDGQRQRLLLARALVTEPDVLILDEPSAFLDVGARVDLMSLLHRIARTRMITVLISTHEVELALRMADRLWLIHDHRLTSGTAQELIDQGLIADVFGTEHAVFDASTRTFGVRD